LYNAQGRMASLSQRRCFRFFFMIWLCHHENSAPGRTKPKKAPFEITGNNVVVQQLIAQERYAISTPYVHVH